MFLIDIFKRGKINIQYQRVVFRCGSFLCEDPLSNTPQFVTSILYSLVLLLLLENWLSKKEVLTMKITDLSNGT